MTTGNEAHGGGALQAHLRIVVVCPNQLVRSLTVAGLSEVDGLSAEECAELGDMAGRPAPDLVLFQDQESRSNGDWLSAQLRRASRIWPGAKRMVLTADIQQGIGICLDAGAHACLPSHAGLDQIVASAQLARHGMAVYPDRVLRALVDAGRRSGTESATHGRISTINRLAGLTDRQKAVVRLLATGLSNKAIAQRLDIAESTVKVHVRAIIEHSGLQNRTEVAAHFMAVSGGQEIEQRHDARE